MKHLHRGAISLEQSFNLYEKYGSGVNILVSLMQRQETIKVKIKDSHLTRKLALNT